MPHSPADSSDKSEQDRSQNTITETTVEISGSLGNRVEDSVSGDKSMATDKENKQSRTSENEMNRKETKMLNSRTTPTSVDISKIEEIPNSNIVITANAKETVTHAADTLPSCEIIKAQSPVAGDKKAELHIKGRQYEKSSSHTQSASTTHDEVTPSLPQITPEDVDLSETTQLILNLKPHVKQGKETNFAVLDQEMIPGNKCVNDMTVKPIGFEPTQSHILTHFDEQGVTANNISPKPTTEITCKEELMRDFSAESANNIGVSVEQEQNDQGQTPNIIHANDTLPSTLGTDSVKRKNDVGRKIPEVLHIQMETVTVCKFPKNVENQLNKEPLSQGKGSKPTEKLNDVAMESSVKHSQSSCSEELKGTTIKDKGKELTKPEKPSDRSLEERRLQPESKNKSQIAITDALEEKSTERKQAMSVPHETAATVADEKHEWEILLKEKSGIKETQQAEQKIKAPTMKNNQVPAKHDKVKDNSTDIKDRHADEKQNAEIKARSPQNKDDQSNKDMNSTAKTEMSNQKYKKDFLARDQFVYVQTKEENTNRPADSKSPNVDQEQEPETHKAPNKEMETYILQMDTVHILTETIEINNSPEQSLVKGTVLVGENIIQEDLMSIIIGEQDEAIIKPYKSLGSKCSNDELEESVIGRSKVRETTKESQKTGTAQQLDIVSPSTDHTGKGGEIKNLSLSLANQNGGETSNLVHNERRSVTESNQIKTIGIKLDQPNSIIPLKPGTGDTTALKSREEQNIETDTIQEDSDAEGATGRTESRDLSVISSNGAPAVIANTEVSSQQFKKHTLTGQNEKIANPEKAMKSKSTSKLKERQRTDTIQDLNTLRTSVCTRERTEEADSALDILMNNTEVDNSNLNVSNQKGPMFATVKDTENVERNKTDFTFPHANLKQVPQSDSTKVTEKTCESKNEKLNSIQEGPKGTDSSSDTLSLTPMVTANSQVVQIPITVNKDQDGEIQKLGNKSTEPKVLHSKMDLKQETNAIRKQNTSESQIWKLKGVRANTLCIQEAEDKADTKDSQMKIPDENADVSTEMEPKPLTVTNEHENIKETENGSGLPTDFNVPNLNQSHEAKIVTKDSKLIDKSSVSQTDTVTTKSDDINNQSTVTEWDEDGIKVKQQEKINTTIIDVKQEAEPNLIKDVANKVVGREQRCSATLNNKADCTNVQKNHKDKMETLKTGRGVNQESQVLKEISEIVCESTKPTLIVNQSLPTAKTQSTPAQVTKTDSPSSWLNVEHKQKQKKEHKKRINASASEDESAELDDFEDFIKSIKEGGAPFALPPKRYVHKKSASPSPHFVMPAIKEDRFERALDPEEFQFGLRKNGKSFRDPSPAMVIKQKAANREAGTKGTREQHDALPTSQSSFDEVEGKDGVKEATEPRKEAQNNGEEPGKLTSRLERMSILSSLRSSPRITRKTKEEATPASNSPLSSNQQQDTPGLGKQLANDSPLLGLVHKEGVESKDESPLVTGGISKVSESALSPSSPPPLPSFSEIKLSDHLEKCLKKNTKESEASQGSMQMTKTKLNPEESTVIDTPSIAGVVTVDAGLPLTVKYNQEKPQNGVSSTKTKVSI